MQVSAPWMTTASHFATSETSRARRLLDRATALLAAQSETVGADVKMRVR